MILSVGDAVAAAAPIGLFFGRIANFINGELWGRPSDAPWAVVFPGRGGAGLPGGLGRAVRAASLAALRGGAGGSGAFRRAGARHPRRGAAAAGPGLRAFLVGYALARVALEQFRQADMQFVTPDNPHGHVLGGRG